jgi:hypothetical protein
VVVRDEHTCRPDGAQRTEHFGADHGAQARVKGSERLVEQHQPRPGRESARDRDSLLLTAGQLVRISPAESGRPRAEPARSRYQ